MKSGTQGCALEACVEAKAVSQALSMGSETHAWPLEALQNAAPVSQISIMGAKGTFARITIKIAKGIIALVFNRGSSESVSKRIHKAQACLEMALDWR